jgi:flagellar biosynthesis protein FlhF
MNARKFIAASSRDALKLVRVELGEDAVILSNRKVPEGVEIVAMLHTELAHLSETRMCEGAAKSTRPGKLTTQGANQAAALGAKVLEANAARSSKPVQQSGDATAEQQTLLSEIKSMRNLLQEQIKLDTKQ